MAVVKPKRQFFKQLYKSNLDLRWNKKLFIDQATI
jgi:hypothetical protein